MDYWEPDGGLLAPSEIATLDKFTAFLGKYGGDEVALKSRFSVTTTSPIPNAAAQPSLALSSRRKLICRYVLGFGKERPGLPTLTTR